jgi:hypothetical protein
VSRRRIGPWTTAAFAAVSDIPFVARGIDISGGNGVLHALHGALVPIVFVIALGVAWRACKALEIGARTRRGGRNGGGGHDPALRPNRQRVLQ